MAALVANPPVATGLGKGSGTLSASQATGSITPVSGRVIYVWVASTFATAPNTPTMTGTNGLSVTWTAIANVLNSGNTQKLTLFRGVPSSSVAGVLTIAFAGQLQLTVSWQVVTVTVIDQTTSQGVVQSITGTANAATEKALAFAAGPTNNVNAILYGAFDTPNTTFTPKSGFTAIDTQADAQGTIGTEFMVGSRTLTTLTPPDIAPTGTFGASGTICAIAIEVKALYALDVRPTAGGLLPGLAMAHIAQSGSRRFRGIFTTGGEFGGRPSFGGVGPTGYPAGDSAGLAAVSTPGSLMDKGYWPFKTQRDDTVGNPDPPSQRMASGKQFLSLVVAGVAGVNTWTVDVKFEAGNGPYPRFIAREDPKLGLYADVAVAAAAPASIDDRTGISGSTQGMRKGGYAWQTLTLVFTLAADGAVELRREKQTPGRDSVWWDNLVPA